MPIARVMEKPCRNRVNQRYRKASMKAASRMIAATAVNTNTTLASPPINTRSIPPPSTPGGARARQSDRAGSPARAMAISASGYS